MAKGDVNMKKEFNLSEKIQEIKNNALDEGLVDSAAFFLIDEIEEDIKEFIKRVKEILEEWGNELTDVFESEDKSIRSRLECPECRRQLFEMIDNLAGEKLSNPECQKKSGGEK